MAISCLRFTIITIKKLTAIKLNVSAIQTYNINSSRIISFCLHRYSHTGTRATGPTEMSNGKMGSVSYEHKSKKILIIQNQVQFAVVVIYDA